MNYSNQEKTRKVSIYNFGWFKEFEFRRMETSKTEWITIPSSYKITILPTYKPPVETKRTYKSRWKYDY
jgi:hypothetical protein